MNRDQTMKTKGGPSVIEGQPLVTKGRRNPAGAKQRGQQMALRITKAGPMFEHIGRDAGDNWDPVVGTVPHIIAHPEKAALGYLFIIGCIPSNLGGGGNNGGRGTVNDRGGI